MNYAQIAENYAVAAQINANEVTELAHAGFTTIICNRPDNEEPGQPSADDIAEACKAAGMGFHHIPVTAVPIPEDDVAAHRQIVEESAGPVLAYCRSGQRSAVIYQAGE